jgi:hypothetical protein
MELILIIVVLLLLFGGGGGYWPSFLLRPPTRTGQLSGDRQRWARNCNRFTVPSPYR